MTKKHGKMFLKLINSENEGHKYKVQDEAEMMGLVMGLGGTLTSLKIIARYLKSSIFNIV